TPHRRAAATDRGCLARGRDVPLPGAERSDHRLPRDQHADDLQPAGTVRDLQERDPRVPEGEGAAARRRRCGEEVPQGQCLVHRPPACPDRWREARGWPLSLRDRRVVLGLGGLHGKEGRTMKRFLAYGATLALAVALGSVAPGGPAPSAVAAQPPVVAVGGALTDRSSDAPQSAPARQLESARFRYVASTRRVTAT